MSPYTEEERRGGNNPARVGKRACDKKQHGVEEEQPRIRGEKTKKLRAPAPALGTTPHARGKERTTRRSDDSARNNPAYAGKREDTHLDCEDLPEQPRVRGVDPRRSVLRMSRVPFPRVCGVVPPPIQQIPGSARFPRVCGVVPLRSGGVVIDVFLSPHVRGCSHQSVIFRASSPFFPAYAGLFPS